MRVDLDENVDKDLFHSFKTLIGYSRKLAPTKLGT